MGGMRWLQASRAVATSAGRCSDERTAELPDDGKVAMPVVPATAAHVNQKGEIKTLRASGRHIGARPAKGGGSAHWNPAGPKAHGECVIALWKTPTATASNWSNAQKRWHRLHARAGFLSVLEEGAQDTTNAFITFVREHGLRSR